MGMNNLTRLVSFDAFGTLYVPRELVALQYHKIAKGFGIQKSASQIELDFPKCYTFMTNKFPNYGKYSQEIASCDEWWLELIVRLLEIPCFRDNRRSNQVCKNILDHFVSKDAYRVYDDVIPTLQYLSKKRAAGDLRVIISSNTDASLVKVIKNLGLSEYFDSVYLSYDLGESKPTQAFFNKIRVLEGISNASQIVHIGDELKKDYIGSIDSGWNGILLNREISKEQIDEANIRVINDLRDIKYH